MIPGADWSATSPPSLGDFEEITDSAYRSIPEVLRARVDQVVIRVEEFPDDDTLEELGLETPYDLLGLYQGVSLERKTGWDVPHNVDMIFLYRRPILNYWCDSGDDLGSVIRHVLIHEIGHHFGYSDDDMEALESMQ